VQANAGDASTENSATPTNAKQRCLIFKSIPDIYCGGNLNSVVEEFSRRKALSIVFSLPCFCMWQEEAMVSILDMMLEREVRIKTWRAQLMLGTDVQDN